MDDYLYEAAGIAVEVENALNVKFNFKTFMDVLTLTVRKMELNEHGRSYFKVLFANELKDHAMRAEINEKWRNMKWSVCT